MSNIIAGRFQTQDEVAFAIDELERIGVAHAAISAFYVNPAGQHDLYPIGGDQDKSRGAKETGKGVVEGVSAGGVVGVAVGAAALPVAGPVAPVVGGLVGGYVGSLIGSMHATKERFEPEEGGENREVTRKAGMMVAVATESLQQEHDVLALLKSINANAIERSNGTIVDGDWEDFDPLSAPQFQS
jgi:phage tail tape-measure protein